MVHLMQEKSTGQCRVLKTVLRPEGWDDDRLKLEAEILQNLDHPHILRIFRWYEDHEAVNIVMEHCEGGELLKCVREGRRRGEELNEQWIALALRQIFEALVYIHAKGVVHKDLKGQNLLLLHSTESEDGSVFKIMPHIVVCDLGIAEVCARGIFGLRGNKVAGTPATMAPEVWQGSCGPKSDVWSMGCVMFEIFTNRLPFDVDGNIVEAAKQRTKWLEMHKKGPKWELMKCSEAAKAVCKSLLTFKETSRAAAVDILKHEWFQVCNAPTLTPEEVDSLCSTLCTWRDRSPTQRALCLKMAVGCTCISKFARVFTMFDTDNSGILDRSEVVSALMSLGVDKQMAKKTAAALDINGDNSCEYIEFSAACLLSLEDQFDELLRQEFRSLDVRKAGELSDKELAPLLSELQKLATSRGLKLAELDTDGDGSCSFEEFCAYFGRPGVQYKEDPATVAAKAKRQMRASLPMKQHVRILAAGPGASAEQTMEVLQKSMTLHSKDTKTSSKEIRPDSPGKKRPETKPEATKVDKGIEPDAVPVKRTSGRESPAPRKTSTPDAKVAETVKAAAKAPQAKAEAKKASPATPAAPAPAGSPPAAAAPAAAAEVPAKAAAKAAPAAAPAPAAAKAPATAAAVAKPAPKAAAAATATASTAAATASTTASTLPSATATATASTTVSAAVSPTVSATVSATVPATASPAAAPAPPAAAAPAVVTVAVSSSPPFVPSTPTLNPNSPPLPAKQSRSNSSFSDISSKPERMASRQDSNASLQSEGPEVEDAVLARLMRRHAHDEAEEKGEYFVVEPKVLEDPDFHLEAGKEEPPAQPRASTSRKSSLENLDASDIDLLHTNMVSVALTSGNLSFERGNQAACMGCWQLDTTTCSTTTITNKIEFPRRTPSSDGISMPRLVSL